MFAAPPRHCHGGTRLSRPDASPRAAARSARHAGAAFAAAGGVGALPGIGAERICWRGRYIVVQVERVSVARGAAMARFHASFSLRHYLIDFPDFTTAHCLWRECIFRLRHYAA